MCWGTRGFSPFLIVTREHLHSLKIVLRRVVAAPYYSYKSTNIVNNLPMYIELAASTREGNSVNIIIINVYGVTSTSSTLISITATTRHSEKILAVSRSSLELLVRILLGKNTLQLFLA